MITIDPIIVDGDNTLWKGNVSEAIGKAYLATAARNLQLITLARGTIGAIQVKKMVRDCKDEEATARGAEKFYKTLIDNGMGWKREIAAFAKNYIRYNTVSSVSDSLNYHLALKAPVFLSTMSGTTAAETAAGLFEMEGFVSNTEIFSSLGRLAGFQMVMTSGESKLAKTEEMLDRHGLRVSSCMVIGDSVFDIPLLRSAKIAVASPYASEQVLAIKGIRRFS